MAGLIFLFCPGELQRTLRCWQVVCVRVEKQIKNGGWEAGRNQETSQCQFQDPCHHFHIFKIYFPKEHRKYLFNMTYLFLYSLRGRLSFSFVLKLLICFPGFCCQEFRNDTAGSGSPAGCFFSSPSFKFSRSNCSGGADVLVPLSPTQSDSCFTSGDWVKGV